MPQNAEQVQIAMNANGNIDERGQSGMRLAMGRRVPIWIIQAIYQYNEDQAVAGLIYAYDQLSHEQLAFVYDIARWRESQFSDYYGSWLRAIESKLAVDNRQLAMMAPIQHTNNVRDYGAPNAASMWALGGGFALGQYDDDNDYASMVFGGGDSSSSADDGNIGLPGANTPNWSPPPPPPVPGASTGASVPAAQQSPFNWQGMISNVGQAIGATTSAISQMACLANPASCRGGVNQAPPWSQTGTNQQVPNNYRSPADNAQFQDQLMRSQQGGAVPDHRQQGGAVPDQRQQMPHQTLAPKPIQRPTGSGNTLLYVVLGIGVLGGVGFLAYTLMK